MCIKLGKRRRGSVSIEGLMVLPIAVTMIFMGKFILEASLNRQETAVYARGSAQSVATARGITFRSCAFDDQDFQGRTGVAQSVTVDCRRRGAERDLSREEPMWDAVEDGASDWDEILWDVKPRSGPRDIIADARVELTFAGSDFLSQQDKTIGEQSFLTPDGTLWTHKEGRLNQGHDKVIWDELCKSGTYWLFPQVFRHGGGPRC